MFGSVARGDADARSDIELAAEFDPTARTDLIWLVGLEQELGDLFGRPVEILPEPIQKERPWVNVDRDRIRAF
jgi:predicted nucleotidyltransferase